MTEKSPPLGIEELCAELHIEHEICIELVEHGLVRVEHRDVRRWLFDSHAQARIGRAVRLHRELEIRAADVPMVVELLEERDSLRAEIESLRQRLARFVEGGR